MAQTLSGILVVAIEQAVAAPLCTARLAEAGARIIKVERPEGDFARGYDDVVHGESAYFVWLNAGKESVTLDFRQEEDLRLLRRMIARADVFIQNLAPGAAERAGLGSAALRKENPRLITCDISGYGEDGPYREMKAYDLLVQCEAGLASITGAPEQPGRVGVSVADISCGMNAYAGILEALYGREKTGKGTGISVSLFDALADWMNVPYLHQVYGGKGPPRIGIAHPGIAPYGVFRTGRGEEARDIVISIQNEREWHSFCAHVLQNEALANDPRFVTNSLRVTNRPQLDAEISTIFIKLAPETLIDRLRDANIAYGSVNSVADLADHPQLRRAEIASPTGSVSLIPFPVRRQDDTSTPRAVPALGEHNKSLRAEFS